MRGSTLWPPIEVSSAGALSSEKRDPPNAGLVNAVWVVDGGGVFETVIVLSCFFDMFQP